MSEDAVAIFFRWLPFLALYALFAFDVILVAGRRARTGSRILWLFLLVILPVIGHIIYAFVGRKALIHESNDADVTDGAAAGSTLPQPAAADIPAVESGAIVQRGKKLGLIFSTPEQVRKVTTVMGILISIVAIISGLAAVALIILIAAVMYACSRPGAKCM